MPKKRRVNCTKLTPMKAHKKHCCSPLTPLYSDLYSKFGVEVWMKRDDLNHPTIQGNKWHKLKYNLEQAQKLGKSTLITFGGAFSNHIAATAAAANSYGLKSIGIIRGQELAQNPQKWSHTLKTAQQNGMQLEFIDRQTYRNKDSQNYLDALQSQYPNSYILPEGGTNGLAILGFDELMQDIQQQCPNWTHLFCPVGTGGTFTGLSYFANQMAQTNKTQKVIGVAVLKQAEYLIPQIENWLANLWLASLDIEKPDFDNNIKPALHPDLNQKNWQLLSQYHDGGYAKKSKTGEKFQQEFEEEFGILLDPVYTSKMLFAFYDQLKKQNIPRGSKVILLHTGGLQGRK